MRLLFLKTLRRHLSSPIVFTKFRLAARLFTLPCHSRKKGPALYRLARFTTTCPQQMGTADSKMDIEDLDKRCGFSRREMGSLALAGTVDAYDHHLLVHTRSSNWPKDLNKDEKVLGQLVKAFKAYKKENKISLRATAFVYDDQAEDAIDENAAGLDVIAFPAGRIYKTVKPSQVPDVLDHLLKGTESNDIIFEELDNHSFALVCGHGTKDERCGHCGPLLVNAIKAEAAKRGTPCRRCLTSHVGGHKYAGNVILYPRGDWYGYVTPTDVPELFDSWQAAEKDNIVRRLWRGRMGLSKQQQREFVAQLE